jgi:hypothetical protein
MNQTNPKAVAQLQELQQKIQQDTSTFSDFERDFIADQIERINRYCDDTFFSEKQAALVERIHAERVRGEVVERAKKKSS